MENQLCIKELWDNKPDEASFQLSQVFWSQLYIARHLALDVDLASTTIGQEAHRASMLPAEKVQSNYTIHIQAPNIPAEAKT